MAAIQDDVVQRERAFAGCHYQEALRPTAEWLRQAEVIATGSIYFYDTEPIAIGLENIDWHAGHRQHQEWRAQLNRFGFLTPLAIAYRETGEERFAAAARAYIEDWMRFAAATAASDGEPFYCSPLCLSIRVGTSHHVGWCGTLPLFAGSVAYDDDFVQRLLASVTEQLTWLRTHLTPLGNMRVSEFDALLFTALRLPALHEIAAHQDEARRGLRNALRTQFLADGAHVELSPSYGGWMTRVLADYAWLQQCLPELDLGIGIAQVERALCYMTHGLRFPVNDCWRPDDSSGEQRQLELSRRLIQRLDPSRGADWMPPRDAVFPRAGQLFLRTGWSNDSASIGMDISGWGGSHAHASRLAINFHHGGRELLADPGILDYEMRNPLAAYGKWTRAHTTISLDGMNQGPSRAHLLREEQHDRFALVHGRYDGGYWDGPLTWGFREGCGKGTHGIHDRIIWWLRDDYLLVLDLLVAQLGSDVHNVWQLGPMDGVRTDADQLSVHTTNAETNLLLRMVLAPDECVMSCEQGQLSPPAGWVGSSFRGAKQVPAPQVVYRYPAGRPAGGISAVLAMPFAGSEVPQVRVVRQAASSGGISQYLVLDFGDGRRDYLGWSPQLVQAVELDREVETDATFFWVRQENGGPPREGFLLDGAYLRIPELHADDIRPEESYFNHGCET